MTLRDTFEEVEVFLRFVEETGEDLDPQALRDTFEGIIAPMQDKLDSYAEVYNALNRDADAFEAEGKRCFDKADSLRNNAKRVKETVAYFVDMLPERKVKTMYHRFGYKKNGGALGVEIDETVPDEYIIYEPKVDTKRIKEELNDGLVLEFARFKERGEHFEMG